MNPPVIGVLGLGEAGSLVAADLLAAGATVRGFDPLVAAGAGVVPGADDADAARGCDVVVALTSSHEAEDTLRGALPGMKPQGIYADLNTASAAVKQRLARSAVQAGVVFVDVAVMSPVPGKGLTTPMLASGPGAVEFARQFTALGASVTVLPGPAGVAATRKLVRSVFYKGLAAAVVEALQAGRAAGCEEWLRENIRAELRDADEHTIDRLENGSRRHARRRADEMASATELLDDLGVPSRVAAASRDWLIQLLDEQPGS